MSDSEGAWHTRWHVGPRWFVWRNTHFGTDQHTPEVRVVEITVSRIGDAPVLPDLLSQIPAGEEVGSVAADGAYDPGLRPFRAELIHWISSKTPLTPRVQ